LKGKGYEVSKNYNDHAKAVDIRTDQYGHQFVQWLMNEGKSWANQNIREIRRHGGDTTDHYHIVFK